MYAEALSFDDLITFSNSFELKKIILLLVCIAALISVSRFILLVAKYLSTHLSTKKTLVFQVSTIFTFFLNIFGSCYIFYKVLNPPNELLIAFLGSATFAVGFALKDLVASLISGVMIILDPPFQVGDRIHFKDLYGEIKHIGLRAVRLNTNDNQVITIPNLSFVHDAVYCATNGGLNMNVSTNFYLSLNCNIEEVKKILYETVITSKYVYLNKPIAMTVDNSWQQEKLYLQLAINAHVIDTRFEKDFQTDLIVRGTKILQKTIYLP